MAVIWFLVIVTIIMFLSGFIYPDKVKDPKENNAMVAALYLAGILLFVPNRFGALVRRALKQLKRT